MSATIHELILFEVTKYDKDEVVPEFVALDCGWDTNRPGFEDAGTELVLSMSGPTHEQKMVKLLEDTIYIEYSACGGLGSVMNYLLDYYGSDMFEECWQELADIFEAQFKKQLEDRREPYISVLTLWAYQSEMDYWGEYDEWWWMVGVVDSEKMDMLAKSFEKDAEKEEKQMSYQKAPEHVLRLVEEIIMEYHDRLEGSRIAVIMKDKATKSRGQVVMGKAEKFPDK